MPTNKVIYGDQTIIDITDTSATSSDVVEGNVFYAANGTRITGTLSDATQTTHGLMSAADKIKLDESYVKPSTGIPSTDLAENVIPDISGKANSADLATIATSGSYTDLLNRPTIIKGTGTNAVVIGQTTASRASNTSAVAEGSGTASGSRSHAEGWSTKATATGAHAEGYFSQATGIYSHAENGSYTEGTLNLTGDANTKVYTYDSDSVEERFGQFGISNMSLIYNSTVYNITDIDTTEHTITTASTLSASTALNNTAVSYAIFSLASGSNSHAEGNSMATGKLSHAEGHDNISQGYASHSEGEHNLASGLNTHAEGSYNIVSGDNAHGEGSENDVSGAMAHGEGFRTTASGVYSHTEGYGTIASFSAAHAEGYGTQAIGAYSHAEGVTTTTSGIGSHAEGGRTTASGDYSHAEGFETQAQGQCQHTFGRYNILDTPKSSATRGQYIEIVGNGTSRSARNNARTLDWSGNEWVAGTLTAGGGSITIGNTTISESQLQSLLALLSE